LAVVAANFKLPLSVVNVHNVGKSDSDSFQDWKIPAIGDNRDFSHTPLEAR
jgi:hypothetical protein